MHGEPGSQVGIAATRHRLGKSLIAAALFLMLSAPGVRAGDAGRPAAPELDCQVWLNSPALKLSQLRGKVVLIDFWEYTCINCIRTFPYLRRWNRLYGPLGLVVIGVHTPEFAFAKNPARVAEATRRFGFTFPIAVDSDYRMWNAFRNDAWPSKYLIDQYGRIALNHVGEGDYADFEARIQELLKEANPKLDFADARFRIPNDEPQLGGACRRPTPETYLGYARGDRMANPGGYRPLSKAAYRVPGTIPLDRFVLNGEWLATPEFVRHTLATKEPVDYLGLSYRAKSVYLVAGSDDRSSKPLYLTQDGKPLAKNGRGVDVQVDSGGRTYIALAGKRMYYLVNNPTFEEHEVRLYATMPAISLYSFTFGNECENQFDHH